MKFLLHFEENKSYDGHEWLISRMQAMKYPLYGGVCYGSAHVAIDLALSENLVSLNYFTYQINQIPADQFKEQMNNAAKKWQKLNLIEQAKNVVLANKTEPITKKNKQQFDREVAATLLAKITTADNFRKKFEKKIKSNSQNKIEKTLNLSPKSESEFLSSLSKTSRQEFIVFVQDEAEKAIKKLGEKEKDLLMISEIVNKFKIYSLFDSLFTYQASYTLRHFPVNHGSIFQNADNVAPYLMPIELQQRGGRIKILEFEGIYPVLDIFNLLFLFRNQFINYEFPYAIFMGCLNHAISLSKSSKEERWDLINASDMPIKTFTSNYELSRKILPAFSCDTYCAFSTSIYVARSPTQSENKKIIEAHEKLIKNMVNELQQTSLFKKMHTVTKFKATLPDDLGSTWLHIACRQGNITKVQELLKKDAAVNMGDKKLGITPLHIAIREGNLAIVKLLVGAGGNINLTYREKTRVFIELAIRYDCEHEMRAQLPDTKIHWNNHIENFSSLHLAVLFNQSDMVKFLLAHGINIDATILGNVTALRLAQIMRHTQLISILLEAKLNQLKKKIIVYLSQSQPNSLYSLGLKKINVYVQKIKDDENTIDELIKATDDLHDLNIKISQLFLLQPLLYETFKKEKLLIKHSFFRKVSPTSDIHSIKTKIICFFEFFLQLEGRYSQSKQDEFKIYQDFLDNYIQAIKQRNGSNAPLHRNILNFVTP